MPSDAAIRAAKAILSVNLDRSDDLLPPLASREMAAIIDREMGTEPTRPAGRDDADGMRLRQQIDEHGGRVREERKLEGHANAE